jgi:hypothetical protein
MGVYSPAAAGVLFYLFLLLSLVLVLYQDAVLSTRIRLDDYYYTLLLLARKIPKYKERGRIGQSSWRRGFHERCIIIHDTKSISSIDCYHTLAHTAKTLPVTQDVHRSRLVL